MPGPTHHKACNILRDSNNQFWFGVDLEQIRAVKEVPVQLEFFGTGESSWPTNEF